MKLTKLNLANFRAFEHLEITFESDVTVIAGVNGVGKSSILLAIATILSKALPEFSPSRSKPLYFDDEDISYEKGSLETSLLLNIGEHTIHAWLQRMRENGGESDRMVLLLQEEIVKRQKELTELLADRTLTGEIDAGVAEAKTVLQQIKESSTPPLAIYFSPKRQLPGKPKSLPEIRAFDISHAYSRALHDREVELREFMHWFRSQEKMSEQNGVRSRVLEILRSVVTEFVPAFTNLRIVEEPRLGLVVDKMGKPMFLNQLSDGERGLLAMIFDITRRLAIANPESENPLQEGRATVLIDEIELHLHPKWQREVLGRMCDVFQNCQFIITTHSPMVLGEVQSRSVRFLEYDKNGKIIVTIPEEAYGMDANRILQELMGASIRNREIDEKLKQLFETIDDEKFDEAKAMIAKLSQELGEFDPELTRASSLIHFLESDV